MTDPTLDIQRGDTAAAIAALDAINPEDDLRREIGPEEAHPLADDILVAYVPQEVADAFNAVIKRTESWWYE